MGKVRENIIDISVHVKYSKVRDKCVGRKEILMGLDVFDNYECEGQMTIEDFLADMVGSFKHKFAKKPEVIEGNMKALEMALKEIEKVQ